MCSRVDSKGFKMGVDMSASVSTAVAKHTKGTGPYDNAYNVSTLLQLPGPSLQVN